MTTAQSIWVSLINYIHSFIHLTIIPMFELNSNKLLKLSKKNLSFSQLNGIWLFGHLWMASSQVLASNQTNDC